MAEANKSGQILFAAFEATPFIKTGGLGDVAGSLPPVIRTAKYDIRVILPLHSAIPENYRARMRFIKHYNVPLSWRKQYCGLFELEHNGIIFYFLDNEYYFRRAGIYGEFDDGERVAFFSKAVLETIQHIDGFKPSILHCNDWHTALVPVFLREHYMELPDYSKIHTVFTIHNLKFQGKYSDYMIDNILGLHRTPAENQLSEGGNVNYLKGAILYSDLITTVSPTYAAEICTPYFGEGLDKIFNARRDSLRGILNGIDYRQYPLPENKAAAKTAIQKELGLTVNPDIPLFVIIGRLTEQKGMDLVIRILPEIAYRKMQLAILGLGDEKYENTFLNASYRYPDRMAACIDFNEPLSKKMYAGADVFLMPSRFEPCGLSQMIAMHYGTLPLVRLTGGLRDTVIPYNKYTGEGTGFGFENFNAHEMLKIIDDAIGVFTDNQPHWKNLRENAMTADFSWDSSAGKYRKLYEDLS